MPRTTTGLLAMLAAGFLGCAPAPPWADRLDITVAGASAGDVMLCIIDTQGRARCPHRHGEVRAALREGDVATCPGAEARIAARCDRGDACIFPGVPVPAGPFGLVVLDVNPPVFGVPRHAVTEAVIVTPSPDPPSASDRGRLTTMTTALTRCLAPSEGTPSRQLTVVGRSECETTGCALRRVHLKLGGRRAGTIDPRTERTP
jgi:hypothetical protein